MKNVIWQMENERSRLAVFARSQSLPSGDACFDGGLRDGGSHQFGHFTIEDAGNDVIGMQLFRRDDLSDGVRGGDFHLLVDLARAAIERSAKDARESQHVVD